MLVEEAATIRTEKQFLLPYHVYLYSDDESEAEMTIRCNKREDAEKILKLLRKATGIGKIRRNWK